MRGHFVGTDWREFRWVAWRLLLVIALAVWIAAVEHRLNTNLDIQSTIGDILGDHNDTLVIHTDAISGLQRIHVYELKNVLEEVRKWEEYYDTPAGQPKTESKDSQ